MLKRFSAAKKQQSSVKIGFKSGGFSALASDATVFSCAPSTRRHNTFRNILGALRKLFIQQKLTS